MDSTILSIGNILCLKGFEMHFPHSYVKNANYSFHYRFGWLALVLLFTYFALSICINQISRFLKDPFIFSLETNYHSWTYHVPGYSICPDYINISFVNEYYQRSENVTSIDFNSTVYNDYYHYMKIIGSLNAENIHLIDDFEKTELFKNLSGEEIFDIALNVRTFFSSTFHSKMWILSIFQYLTAKVSPQRWPPPSIGYRSWNMLVTMEWCFQIF